MSDSSGRRAPPAFMMYAADRLASRDFRLMGLAERGLLHSCELECWLNGNVPADVDALSRTLGLPVEDVRAALTDRVLARFHRVHEALVCPDLEAYRAKLDEHHRRKSNAGKKGADARWKDGTADGSGNGTASGDANGSLKGKERKGEEAKRAPLGRSDVGDEGHQEWVDGYERGERRAAQ